MASNQRPCCDCGGVLAPSTLPADLQAHSLRFAGVLGAWFPQPNLCLSCDKIIIVGLKLASRFGESSLAPETDTKVKKIVNGGGEHEAQG